MSDEYARLVNTALREWPRRPPGLPPLDDYGNLMAFIEKWELGQAEFLGGLLYDRLRPKSVIDLGCGPGLYLLPFKRQGCQVLGVDAEPAAGGLLEEGEYVALDLRRPLLLGLLAQYDLGLCIEVGEHLQPEFAGVLVQTCVRRAHTVFWSAARPGQGGLHHHNEQPPEYWEALFAEHGYGPHPAQAEVLAAIAADPECRKVGWLLDNARLFGRMKAEG